MDFRLNDEQVLLAESFARLLATQPETTDAALEVPLWAGMIELGLTALPFPEADGGFGGGAADLAPVMEALGRADARVPYLEAVVMPAILARGIAEPARTGLVAQAMAGVDRIVLAHQEPGMRIVSTEVATRAERVAGGHRLSGEKAPVAWGGQAAAFLVSARVSGEPETQGGVDLFLVPAGQAGLEINAHRGPDGRDIATLRFDTVLADDARLTLGAAGEAALREALDVARMASAFEALGLMDAAVHLTIDYLKTRKQFGVAIGSFQALQHRLGDMAVALEEARSAALVALMALESPAGARREGQMAAALLRICRSARFIGQNAVQLHGGIGVTQEYRLGRLFTRLTALEFRFGGAEVELDRLALLPGLFAEG